MYKAFLVEDEQMLLEGLLKTTPWADHGYEVVGYATDAVMARELILKLQPDLVITDIRLPRGTGLELIEELSDQIMCDYIILSGFDHFEYAQRAIDLGVRAYLLKPVDDDELAQALDKLRDIIAHRKHIQETLLDKPVVDNTNTEKQDNITPAFFSLGERYAAAALKYLEDHFRATPSMSQVAEALCISESYLGKLFRKHLGQSYHDTLTERRIQEACRLLIETNMKIYEIANTVGYRDISHFNVQFRKLTGKSPSGFRLIGEMPQ